MTNAKTPEYAKPVHIDGVEDVCIKVWRFRDAPKELQALSNHGGDEDWLAVVPAKYAGTWIPWLESGGPFGCCSVSIYDHPTEFAYEVHIGAHA